MWYIKVIKYLQCLFFVINENESALIIGSKLNPPVTTSDTNWSLKERCKTDDMSTVSSRVPPWSCFSCQDPSGSSRRKVTTQRPLDFFLKQTVTWTRDFLMFSIAYFIFSESNSSVKNNFHLRWQRLSFEEVVFSNVVICLSSTSTSMKTGCTNINITGKT